MIIQWSQEGVGEYCATWRVPGLERVLSLNLKYQPLCRRWWLWMKEGTTTARAAHGTRLLQWQNSRDAKEHIDAVALRVVRNIQHPTAKQSPEDRLATLKQFVKVPAKSSGVALGTPSEMMFVKHANNGGLKPSTETRRYAIVIDPETGKAASGVSAKRRVPANVLASDKPRPRIHSKATPVRKLVTK